MTFEGARPIGTSQDLQFVAPKYLKSSTAMPMSNGPPGIGSTEVGEVILNDNVMTPGLLMNLNVHFWSAAGTNVGPPGTPRPFGSKEQTSCFPTRVLSVASWIETVISHFVAAEVTPPKPSTRGPNPVRRLPTALVAVPATEAGSTKVKQPTRALNGVMES